MSTAQRRVGRYELIKPIGRGGMAEVFLAQVEGPAGFEKLVVVKRILRHLAEDPDFLEMFLNEARLAARFNHPNIVQIFELGQTEASWFIAMEYVDGPNLRLLLQSAAGARSPLPCSHAARIASSVCEALAYAHDFTDRGELLNLVHRDITPDNILIARSGAVKIVDFGIAKAANRPQTRAGFLKGKIWYMAPEQLTMAPLDRRTDLFALGIVLYEMLTGQVPFTGVDREAAIRAVQFEPPTAVGAIRPDCPTALEAIVAKALQKRPEDRYQDARAMQRDLEQYLLGAAAIVTAHEVGQLVEQLVPASKLPPHVDDRTAWPTMAHVSDAPRPCPTCGALLHVEHMGGVAADGCPDCGGIWFDDGELHQLANRPDGLLAIALRFKPKLEYLHRPLEPACPSCRRPLQKFGFSSLPDVELERCELCHGIWLDHGKAEQIQRLLTS